MHRFRSGIVGIVLMAGLAGCGSSVEEGAREFTPTNTQPLDPLSDQMKGMMKKRDYATKQMPTEKDKAKEKDAVKK